MKIEFKPVPVYIYINGKLKKKYSIEMENIASTMVDISILTRGRMLEKQLIEYKKETDVSAMLDPQKMLSQVSRVAVFFRF